jgi:putative endonuclease
MTLRRPPDPDGYVVRGHRAAILLEHFDLSRLDQLLERGAIQCVVGDLASAGQPEEQGLPAGQRDPERPARLVEDALDGRISRFVMVTRWNPDERRILPRRATRVETCPSRARGRTDWAILSTMRWFVYLVRCHDGSLYTGITTDPSSRVRAHNAGRGARYTRVRGPVALVHVEAAAGRAAAQRREGAIKRWTRAEKERLVAMGAGRDGRSGSNPF